MKPSPPLGRDHVISFELSAHWSAEQALDLIEMLSQMKERIFAQYGDELRDLINERYWLTVAGSPKDTTDSSS